MNRNELDALLRETLGSANVYFQPPESVRLRFPCIVYSLENQNDIPADDRQYRRIKRYSLTYITKDPDDPMANTLDDLRYCSMNRTFASDNLHHFVYTIFY